MSRCKGAIVADAVIDQMIAETSWAEAFDITREYIESQQAEDADTIRITVIHAATARKLTARNRRQLTHSILLAIRRNVDPENVDAVDAMTAFAESVADFWDSTSDGGKRVVTGTAATVADVQHDPTYSASDLNERRQFYAVVNLTVVETVTV